MIEKKLKNVNKLKTNLIQIIKKIIKKLKKGFNPFICEFQWWYKRISVFPPPFFYIVKNILDKTWKKFSKENNIVINK